MYLIRSKSSLYEMRDRISGEMRGVGPRAWVEFETLPAGLSPEGDGEVSVKVIESEEDMDAALAENTRMGAEDDLVVEQRELRRQVAADEKARKEGEREAVRKVFRDAKSDDPPPGDAEPIDLDAFVAKHDGEMNKPEIVEWAESLDLDADGTKAELLTAIHAALIEAGVPPE